MPRVVKSAAREIIQKVKEFCEPEQQNQGVLIPINNVRKRVAAMTGVSEKAVSRITREVLRLPPYHCDLNSIEKMWRLVKRRMRTMWPKTRRKFQLTEDAFASVTPEEWSVQCKHVEDLILEDEYFKNDRLTDVEMDRFLISTASDSEESDRDSDMHVNDYRIVMLVYRTTPH